MGAALYEKSVLFRSTMQRMDRLVRDQGGYSVIDEIYRPGRAKSEVFNETFSTHPAIFMVQYALAQVLMDAGIAPDMVLGASLGSYVAATIAGCYSMEDALAAVVHQAQILGQCCPRGGMLAIFAAADLHREYALGRYSEIAAVNFAGHFVVAGEQNRLLEMEKVLLDKGVMYQRLPIEFAFHSQWIDAARAPFEAFSNDLHRSVPSLPLICCARGAVLDCLPADYLWSVARRPILFQQTIEELEKHGTYSYIDVGSSGTLATFLKYLLPRTSRSSACATLTPFGSELENIAALGANLA
jgi:acyl transferase domain-containing protein